jgi:hypothetical protein
MYGEEKGEGALENHGKRLEGSERASEREPQLNAIVVSAAETEASSRASPIVDIGPVNRRAPRGQNG